MVAVAKYFPKRRELKARFNPLPFHLGSGPANRRTPARNQKAGPLFYSPTSRETARRFRTYRRTRGLSVGQSNAFAYFPKTLFILVMTSGGWVITSRAKASSLSPSTGLRQEKLFPCSEFLSLNQGSNRFIVPRVGKNTNSLGSSIWVGQL